MADVEQDHTKFNVGSLLSFRNGDKDSPKTLNFGAYNGNIQISIRNAQYVPGERPVSVNITPQLGYLITEIIGDLVHHPQPGKKRTLIFNGKWNQEARKRELSFQFTVGMDDSAICYIGIKNVNYQNETYTGRFDLTGDRNVDVAEFYDDEKSRSFATLKMLYKYFNDMFFQNASLLTRNHLVQPKFNGNKNSGGGKQQSSSSNVSSASADDEFF